MFAVCIGFISTGGAQTLTYDAAGNVTFDNRNGPGYGYNYDAANRMSSFAINGVNQAEYEYNALGQQVIRRLPQKRTLATPANNGTICWSSVYQRFGETRWLGW